MMKLIRLALGVIVAVLVIGLLVSQGAGLTGVLVLAGLLAAAVYLYRSRVSGRAVTVQAP